MAQFNDEQSCRAFHLELGKDTFLLKGKEVMGYVSEQVKLWSDKWLLAQQREAAERAAEREAALAREAAEKEITLARMAHELEMAKLAAARERPQEQDRVAQAPRTQSNVPDKWSCHHLTRRLRTLTSTSTSLRDCCDAAIATPLLGDQLAHTLAWYDKKCM